MAFLELTPLVLKRPSITNNRSLTTRRSRRFLSSRYRPISAVSVGETSSRPPPALLPSKSLYACVSCGAQLPEDLSGDSCPACGAKYRTTTAGYVDFVPRDNKSLRPISVSLFQSPVVAWLYERGWRDRFSTAGFPGPEAEVHLARTYLDTNGLILDASCGSGVMTRRIDADVALDYSEAMLQEALSRDTAGRGAGKSAPRRYVRADISNMPFQDGSFDGVTAGAALHCWPVVQDALAEIRRVLKPGGKFFATTFARGAVVGNSTVRNFLLPGRSVVLASALLLKQTYRE